MEKVGGFGFVAGINIFSRKEEILPFKGCFRQFDPSEVLRVSCNAPQYCVSSEILTNAGNSEQHG